MHELTEKFIKGLEKYNLTREDIDKQNFKYCGGNKGSHLNYFESFFKKRLKWSPANTDHCICGHRISENCYIINNSEEILLILGNCCIKKFVPKSTRTCEKCECPHKNRVVNRCNKCRIGICDKCNKKCKRKYKLCWNCFNFENEFEDIEVEEIEEEKVIKIGKYKGETYENIFMKDIKYLKWLLTQNWFDDKDTINQLLS